MEFQKEKENLFKEIEEESIILLIVPMPVKSTWLVVSVMPSTVSEGCSLPAVGALVAVSVQTQPGTSCQLIANSLTVHLFLKEFSCKFQDIFGAG